MSNSRINITTSRGVFTLYFGMTAIQIFANKGVEELTRLRAENPKLSDKDLGILADRIKSVAYLVFAGMCNYADLNDVPRPVFAECYEIADEIYQNNDGTIEAVFAAFDENRANEKLLEMLNGKQKKSPLTDETKPQPIGTQ